MTKTERITRNEAIVRLAKRDIPVLKIAEAYGLSHQMIYNIINRAKDEELARREMAKARKEATKNWIVRTIQNNKRTHVRLADVVRGICAQILRLYEGEDAIEMIDYLEKTVSDIYAFDYCRNSAVVINYCEAQKDFARKEV
mgnify:CR=1 FL=1